MLNIPDVHVDSHDHRAWNLLVRIVKDLKFDYIVIHGDFLDVACLSTHPLRRPKKIIALQDEFVAGNRLLDQLQAASPDSRIIYIRGNHEVRIERFIAANQALLGLIDLKDGLEFKRREITDVPYGEVHKIGKLYLTHDCGNAGKFAFSQAVDKVGGNVIHGHTHRIGYIVRGNIRGSAHVGVSIGWLGDKKKADYRDDASKAAEWALGFGVTVMESNGVAHVTPVPIIDYKACVFGKVYK